MSLPEDTVNDFLIAGLGGGVVIMRPPVGRIDPGPAIRLAAWIVAICDHSHEHKDFYTALSAIEDAP